MFRILFLKKVDQYILMFLEDALLCFVFQNPRLTIKLLFKTLVTSELYSCNKFNMGMPSESFLEVSVSSKYNSQAVD